MIKIIEPSFYWPEYTIRLFPFICQHIERCGRICYKSEDKITEGSAEKFIKMLIRSKHESVLEHVSLTAIVICSRSCSHQLVRHRIAAYSQESQRYCDYGKKGLQVICPPSVINKEKWANTIEYIYNEYLLQLKEGILPEDARYLLPNATKTELAVTFNIRQWRHVLLERALNSHAQWEIKNIFRKILFDFNNKLPILFGDLS